jgi:hypothetical protein
MVATLAATLAWLLRLPHKLWPEHPQFAGFLMALILCLVLEVVWTNPRSEPKG